MESTAKARIRLGTQGWGWQYWAGRFYPSGTKPEDYLAFYSQVFDTVEIDTTFYAIPKRSAVLSWARKVPDGFRFTAKVPQVITHANGLKGGYDDLSTFLQTISLLGDKLGPILVQLPPTFGYHNLDALRAFLDVLCDAAEEFRFAVEFRNASLLREYVLSLLREHDMALCLNDLEWMPFSSEATTDFAYFRWLGRPSRNRSAATESTRDLTENFIGWIGRVREVASQVEEVYAFFNDRYGGHGPKTANLLREILGLSPVDPHSIWPPNSACSESSWLTSTGSWCLVQWPDGDERLALSHHERLRACPDVAAKLRLFPKGSSTVPAGALESQLEPQTLSVYNVTKPSLSLCGRLCIGCRRYEPTRVAPLFSFHREQDRTPSGARRVIAQTSSGPVH